jgi:hypothetical protein
VDWGNKKFGNTDKKNKNSRKKIILFNSRQFFFFRRLQCVKKECKKCREVKRLIGGRGEVRTLKGRGVVLVRVNKEKIMIEFKESD